MRVTIWRDAASSAATAMRPPGAAPTHSAAHGTAMATGSSRPVAIARSTDTQVRSEKNTTAGSGRSPLLSGSQISRKPPAPAHSAAGLLRTARPSRGIISREITSHVSSPMMRPGTRMAGAAVVTWEIAVNR